MKLLIAVLVIGMAFAQSKPKTWKQEPTGFKGVEFGVTLEQAKAIVKLANCFRTDSNAPVTCPLVIDVDRFKMQAYLIFVDDRFSHAFGSFPSDHYPDVREIFVDKYGPPTEQKHSVVQNHMGAKYDQEELAWEGKQAIVSLYHYGDKVTEGGFAVARPDSFASSSKKTDEAKKKALQ